MLLNQEDPALLTIVKVAIAHFEVLSIGWHGQWTWPIEKHILQLLHVAEERANVLQCLEYAVFLASSCRVDSRSDRLLNKCSACSGESGVRGIP